MSLQPQPTAPIPNETQRVARAAFPKGNVYMRMRDELGEMYTDGLFAELFPRRGQSAESPGRLTWVTVLQFAEGLSDRQAAEAVRGRMDWKYVLGLELTDPGFDYSVLSEFRERLLSGQKESVLLDELLTRLKQCGLLRARGQQRTDSTHVLAAVRQLNRVEIVGETLRRALNELAEVVPDWMKAMAPPEWFTRYGRRFEQMRLPKERAEREKLLETMGTDGWVLLEAVRIAPQAELLRQLAGVEFLRRMWLQQYLVEVDAEGQGRVRLRVDDNQPPGQQRLHTPYDEEARYSAKRDWEWVGYKTHLTETSEPDEVHLITQVTTTLATQTDMEALDTVHAALAQQDLLPDEHLLDAGYVDAEALVSARQDLGVEICSPVRTKVSWQAKSAEGFDLAQFTIDWDRQQVTCPEGQTSHQWAARSSPNRKAAIQVRFSPAVCRSCPSQAKCTRAQTGARTITFLPQAAYLALHQARTEQATPEFQAKYAQRAGIEGTISQAVRGFELRSTRYIGLAKTHLQMLATAVAINLHRLFDWWQDKLRCRTRLSSFARLAPDLARTSFSGVVK
ncbi:MAG TPA: IS1182 family transposase [Anaerolineae bacterium]|nr:IS1182 family transposase [Anaerolineae bacterium]